MLGWTRYAMKKWSTD